MAKQDRSNEEPVAGGTGATGSELKRLRRRQRPVEADEQRLLAGTAWDDFCLSLQRAGQTLLAKNPGASGLERAVGFRYLSGLVNAAIRFSVDFADPDVPCFFRSPDSRTKWGGENADNQYLIAPIRPDGAYRLAGNRGTAFDFLIEVKEGFMQLGDDKVYETVAASDLGLEAEADFEILFASARPKGHSSHFVPVHADAKLIVIRQYFVDWETERPATFRLERVGNEGKPPTPLTPARMAAILDDAGEWVEASARIWSQWVDRIRADHRPGEIVPAIKYVGGAETIRYGNDYYRLEPGEATIIETDVPDARYWAFQLCGLWFEGRDYTNRQTSINMHQARIDSDGKFRCVLAHEDPGVANWLDAAGHTEGLLQYRWIWTNDNPRPRSRTVPFGELRRHLPADTSIVTGEQRREAIAVRQRHMARREPWA